MFIIDVLVVNRKAFAEFYEKYRGLISSVSAATPAITLLISGSHFDSKRGVKKKVQNDPFFGVNFTLVG